MGRSEVIEFLGDDWVSVRALLADALHSDIGLLSSTNDSILSNSGKMLRPILALLFARACAGTVSADSRIYAAAVELLHNATLLHDDVADESSERRGKPTVNATLGPQAAVLVGDFWLARAVQLVLTSESGSDEVVRLFAKTLVDLSEGEMLQLEKASTANTSEQDYYHIIYCKTASLFEAACVGAAASVDACPEYREAASRYARAAGIAFQIKDDILDYAGDERLGKPVGIDLMERKITLPLLCALEGSEQEAQIRATVLSIPENPDCCARVREFVRSRDGVRKAAEKLDEYIEEAVRSLDVLPAGKARDFLEELVRYNAFRRV